MTLPCLYIYEILLYTKMYLSNFKINCIFHSYDTRNKSDLFISSHNTKLFEQSITYNGVLIYNKLSSEIKSINSTTQFKKILTKFLLEKSFYSVEEFMTKFLICGLCVVCRAGICGVTSYFIKCVKSCIVLVMYCYNVFYLSLSCKSFFF